MKQFEISEELANKILQYLALKPYTEVATLIQELTQIKPINQSILSANEVDIEKQD